MAETIITQHWRERVAERVGSVDPDTLARGIMWAIREGREDLVEYVGRLSRTGARIFRFRAPDGRYFLALIDTNRRSMITVLAEGQAVKRRDGKAGIYEASI